MEVPRGSAARHARPVVPVLMVDQWRTFAEAITAGLALVTDVLVVGIAGDVATAAELGRDVNPLVVVVSQDYAAALLADMRAEVDSGGTRVIVLADAERESGAAAETGDIVRAGCAGWIRRDASVEALVDCIRAVARQETVIPPDVIAQATHSPASSGGNSARGRLLAELTPRQAEILLLMETGMGRRDIAYALSISPGTVRTHVQRLTSRFDVHSAAEAVAMLRRRD